MKKQLLKREAKRTVVEESIIVWAYERRRIKVNGKWRPFTLRDYPFLIKPYREMSDPNTRKVVLMKPVQIGATEAALNATFYFLDVKGESALFMLPTSDALSDMANARLDPILKNSPYLSQLFSDISNVGLKRAGDSALYLRGAQSVSKLEELSAGLVVRDEVSRFPEENADLALRRLEASQYKWVIDLSHPTYPDDKIHTEYQNSSMHEWVVKCPGCGEVQKLDFFDNYHERDNLGCRACSTDWEKSDLIEHGSWQATNPENPVKGFHFNQMISPTVELEELEEKYQEAKKEGGHKIELFHQTALGEPYVASGSKLTEKEIREKMTGPPMSENENPITEEGGYPERIVLGVDVGNKLHWWAQYEKEVLGVGEASKFKDLDRVIDRYDIEIIVIDAQPETRAARAYIDDCPVQGYLCRRSDNLEDRRKINTDKKEIKVNMTEHFDAFFAQFNYEDFQLPSDLPREAIGHLKAPVRVIEDSNRGPVARWKKGTCHIADAGAYALEGIEGEELQSQAWIIP